MKKIAIFLLLLFLLFSCSKHDSSNEISTTSHPDMILNNAEYIIYQKDGNPITLHADKLEFYTEDNYAKATNLSFTTSKEDKSDLIEGTSDEGTIYIKEKIIEMTGNVEFRKIDDEMEIRSDSILYDSEKNVIESNGLVVVKSKNGSFTGKDFKGDMQKEEYTFSSIEKGELKYE